MNASESLAELLWQLADRGLVALVKADGERRSGRWTVVVSGQPLGEDYIRWDGDDLSAGLSQVTSVLSRRVPDALR